MTAIRDPSPATSPPQPRDDAFEAELRDLRADADLLRARVDLARAQLLLLQQTVVLARALQPRRRRWF